LRLSKRQPFLLCPPFEIDKLFKKSL